MSQQYDQAQRVQYPTGDSGEIQWTQEQVFGLYNQMTQDYWLSRGFIMPTSHGSPAPPSLPSGVPAAPLPGNSIQPVVPQVGHIPGHYYTMGMVLTPLYQQQQQPVIVPMPGTPYYLLPQQPYIAKRKYQPQGPIVFRTATTGYISLLDAMNGNLAQLLDGDVSVFSGDNLSQKQSIRLEVRWISALLGSPDYKHRHSQSLRRP